MDCASLCNESKLIRDPKKGVMPSGLPTEAALKVLVEKVGAYDQTFNSPSASVERYNDNVAQ